MRIAGLYLSGDLLFRVLRQWKFAAELDIVLPEHHEHLYGRDDHMDERRPSHRSVGRISLSTSADAGVRRSSGEGDDARLWIPMKDTIMQAAFILAEMPEYEELAKELSRIAVIVSQVEDSSSFAEPITA